MSPIPSNLGFYLPTFLSKYLISEDAFLRWIDRQAARHLRHSKKRGLKGSKSAFRQAILDAVNACGGRDFYTGKALDWRKISTWNNEDAKKQGKAYKRLFHDLPTVDHADSFDPSRPSFRICAWKTNDAKGDLSLEEFLELCRRIMAHARRSSKRA